MSWSAATLWWTAAGLLVLAELATGTFYLLMLAVGVVGAALVAHAGLGLSAQLVVASLVGGVAVLAWRQRQLQTVPQLALTANRDLHLDVGGRVTVAAWNADGRCTVNYRGSNWQARATDAGVLNPGPHVIVAVEANLLVLSPAPTTA